MEGVGARLQLAVLEFKAKQRICGRQHAGRRAGVPAPPASPFVAIAIVDVGRLLMRRQPIDVGGGRRRELGDRRDRDPRLERPAKQLVGGARVAVLLRLRGKLRQRVDEPGYAMRILAAVFPHARRIFGAAPGIGLRVFVERRMDEQYAITETENGQGVLDRLASTRGVDGARQSRP